MRRSDAIVGLVIGFIIGIFLLPTLYNTELIELLPRPYLLLLVALPAASAAGLAVARLFERRIPFLWQVLKFGQIGVLNTALDLGIFNLLIFATGFNEGWPVAAINLISFTLVVVNSYFWNKFWVFRGGAGVRGREFVHFIIVSVAAALASTAIVGFMTTPAYVTPIGDLSGEQWANVAKSIAIVTSFTLNFFGYKFLVFRSS